LRFVPERFGYTTKPTPEATTVNKSLQAKDYAALGAFRHTMRKLLRFSKEVVATPAKPTTAQYDALLAIKGNSEANGMTVGEISERLQVKHPTAVSLLDKLETRKLATRKRATADKRNVSVQLTKAGASLLARLAAIHHRELQQRTPEIIEALRRLRE
jgi:DNA-binding MarR family transcriptional regulator